LISLYEKVQNWIGFADTVEAWLKVMPPQEKPRSGPLHVKLAHVYEQRLNDDTKAALELRRALEIEPQDPDALTTLARIYAKSANTFPQAIDIHRRLLRIAPFRVESYHELFRMFEKRGDLDKAFVTAEILVFLRAQSQV